MTVESEKPMSSEEMEEQLTIPDGFRITGESIEIAVAYTGESVTYRSQSGDLVQMDVLCYLDHVVDVAIKQNIDPETGEVSPGGIHPGIIACHMIQHLHQSMHLIQMRKMTDDGIDGLMQALASAMDGLDPKDINAMRIGPDEGISINEVDEPEEEIIIGEIPPRKRH